MRKIGEHWWNIKSKQGEFYVIERVDNLADIRRISLKGWEQAITKETKDETVS